MDCFDCGAPIEPDRNIRLIEAYRPDEDGKPDSNSGTEAFLPVHGSCWLEAANIARGEEDAHE